MAHTGGLVTPPELEVRRGERHTMVWLFSSYSPPPVYFKSECGSQLGPSKESVLRAHLLNGMGSSCIFVSAAMNGMCQCSLRVTYSHFTRVQISEEANASLVRILLYSILSSYLRGSLLSSHPIPVTLRLVLPHLRIEINGVNFTGLFKT